MFNFQRGILRRELAQGFAHLGLSALARTFDRKAEHRLGHDQRAQAKITGDGSVVQDRVVVDFLDLGDGPDVTGDDLRRFLVVLTLHLEEMRDTRPSLGIVNVRIRLQPGAALMNPKDAELAHERVG